MERSDTKQQNAFYCIHLRCLGLVTEEHFYTSNFLYGKSNSGQHLSENS